jgi:hypothetical protein
MYKESDWGVLLAALDKSKKEASAVQQETNDSRWEYLKDRGGDITDRGTDSWSDALLTKLKSLDRNELMAKAGVGRKRKKPK